MKHYKRITFSEVLVIVFVLFVFACFIASYSGVVDPAFEAARRVSAKNDAVQISTAINAYKTEYGRFPSTIAEVQDVNGPLLQALLGSNSNLNPRQIVFLEIPAARKGKGGLTNGVYVDPWGFTYKMKLDIDGDKRITDVGPAFSPTAAVTNKDVAVWNDPDYHADRPDQKSKARRAVTSW